MADKNSSPRARARPSSPQWFCVHTKPRKEESAERYLREQLGVKTYYPRLKRQKTIRRVKRWILRPLFPRYLFCRLDPTDPNRAVRFAPQVIDLVRFGGKPALVEGAIIRELKRWAGKAVDVVTIQPGLLPGDLVEITEGPWRGLQAIFQEEMNDRQRVAVLLTALELRARLVLDRSQVIATR